MPSVMVCETGLMAVGAPGGLAASIWLAESVVTLADGWKLPLREMLTGTDAGEVLLSRTTTTDRSSDCWAERLTTEESLLYVFRALGCHVSEIIWCT